MVDTEDYEHVRKLITSAITDKDEQTLRALLSNNLNIILAALELAVPAKVEVPPDDYRVPEEWGMWFRMTKVLLEGATADIGVEAATSVVLSTVSRELRRAHGAQTAATIMHGYADTQDEAMAGDRP